jgi:hypothetical protein
LYVQLFVGTFHAQQEKEIYILVRSEEITFFRLNFYFFSFQLSFWEDWHWLLARSDHKYNKEKDGAATKRWIFATATSENGVCITQQFCHIMISHDCS